MRIKQPEKDAVGFVGSFGKKDTQDLMNWLLWGDDTKFYNSKI